MCVCVPTFRRSALLDACLAGLMTQSAGHFSYSILVIDNDPHASGREVVARWQQRSDAPVIRYETEPESNIARARNRAVQCASGSNVAFIDDDEVPGPDWLANLVAAHRRFVADGVLGPVVPKFAGTPPRWLVESRLCDRQRYVTGTVLEDERILRTGNVLLDSRLLRDEQPFDPRFGRTGGEDTEFFARQLRGGARFVWCDEAAVEEWVPLERQTLRFYVRRAFVLGATAAERERALGAGTLKSILASLLYAAALPVALLRGPGRAAAVLVRLCNHAAKLLAHVGVRPFHVRSVENVARSNP